MQKLSFEQFVETIQKRIGSFLPKDYEGAQIELRHVTKNNNVTLTGLNICLPGNRVTPSIYLEYFFDSYMKEDLNIDEILQKIVEVRINNSVPPEEFNLDELLDFDKVKDRIYPKLVNRDDFNHDYLVDKPFMVIANLACIYQIDVGKHKGDTATITISDGILHNWHIHLDELHDIAIENMKKNRPSVFMGMSEVLKELTNMDIPLTETGEMMWILTNKDKYAGAANVLDTDIMEEICEKFDNKFLIIFSSVHEIIILSSEGVDPYNLLEIISEINGSEVRPEEVLSNDLYMYDREKKTIVKF